MIQFISLENSSQKREWALSLDPEHSTYIVSDLATKSEVQRHFFLEKKLNVLQEDSVLRANEFWLKAITQNFFDFQMISPFLAQTLLQQWVNESDLKISPSGVKRLQGYFQQLLPIITHGSSVDILRQWFSENPESFISWGRWYELSVMAWENFNQQQLIPQNCLSAYLLANIEEMKLDWPRDLYFDLGADLNLTEVELIFRLSQTQNITVIIPDQCFLSKYESLFSSYKILMEKSGQPKTLVIESSEPSAKKCKPKKVFKRFSTVVSEVKDLTAQVRLWLEAGADPEKISVVTPNIEQYWPILKPYFDQEGIPLIKNEIIIAATLPAVSRWIARLRIYSGKLSSVDIELVEFAGEDLKINFEDFKKLYSIFYDESDLKRDQKLYEKYFRKVDIEKNYLRDEFLVWSLGFWQSIDEHDILKVIFNQILLECPQKTIMQLKHWLAYLEQIVSKKEITVEKSSYGVNCINLSASSWLESDYLYLVGLSSNQFRTNPIDAIDLGEISKLYQQTGYLVDKFNASGENFLLSWVARKQANEIIFSYPETGINGEVGAPVLFWLEEKYNQDQETHSKNIPLVSLWDLRQKLRAKRLSANSPTELVVSTDLGRLPPGPLKDKNYVRSLRFSPTSLERYLSCPFIFLAEKIFNLQDFPDIDFDENPMNRGRLSHAIVEKLTVEPFQSQRSEGDLIGIIEACKQELQLEYYSQEIWHYHRKNYLKLAKNFLSAEKNYRQEFPQTMVKFREKKLKLFWNTDLSGFSKEGYPFNTVIDRVDENKIGDFVIIDYKASATQATNYESWIKNKNVQMPLYILAFDWWLNEHGLEKKFAGSFYYVLKDMTRNKGLKVTGHDESLYLMGSKRSQADNESLQQLKDQVAEITNHVVNQAVGGNFAAFPENTNICNQCNWRSVCRAPHLN